MIRGVALLLALTVLPQFALAQDNTGLEALTRREQRLGWEAVGRIDLGNKGFCTGTLIAADLVLTAAHCLYDGKTPFDPQTLQFRAGLAGDSVIAQSGVARIVMHPGYDPGENDPNAESVRHDAALMVLDHPISTAVAAPFMVESPGDGRQVSVVSYAAGRADVLSWQRACAVKGRAKGLLAFDCDVTFGASGAPVFDRSDGRAAIVSIVSAAGELDGVKMAFGMELPSLVADLKTALRSGRGVIAAGETVAPAAATTAPAGKKFRRLSSDGTTSRDIGARFVKP